ncbi:response regulator [Spirosoma sp. HMF4905]|uniref:Response regulator n=1 Tax=Spirosoma arboris TaxID=2682092 RepID=A0A7K1SR19_9BACT|nr:response regulator [Spirosoma arboris]MVM36227.1 response regulator [Spirosoma arboris]
MPDIKSFEILVVDDEPPICELLERVASQLFPEATFINARSAQETLDHLDQKADKIPQLILLDIDLGTSVNGLDLIPQLNDRLKGKTPIVMLTSSTEPPVVKQAYEKGAVAYTLKPDNLQGWRTYVTALRSYWHDTTILPTTIQP